MSKFSISLLWGIVLFVLFLQQGCQLSDDAHLQKLKGHWHMEHPYNLTLDISDSIVVVNQYSLTGDHYQFPLRDSKDRSISLPIPCGCGESLLPAIKKIKFNKDTLIYDDEKAIEDCYAFSPVKFVKSDIDKCKWSHALGWKSELINVSNFPKANSNLINGDSLRREKAIITLLIGYAVEQEQYGVNPKILARHTFIDITEIPFFLENERTMYDTTIPLMLFLAIDTSVPEDFVKDVINAIPNDKINAIFQMVWASDETTLGYQQIR